MLTRVINLLPAGDVSTDMIEQYIERTEHV